MMLRKLRERNKKASLGKKVKTAETKREMPKDCPCHGCSKGTFLSGARPNWNVDCEEEGRTLYAPSKCPHRSRSVDASQLGPGLGAAQPAL